jgi:hypothetical protein
MLGCRHVNSRAACCATGAVNVTTIARSLTTIETCSMAGETGLVVGVFISRINDEVLVVAAILVVEILVDGVVVRFAVGEDCDIIIAASSRRSATVVRAHQVRQVLVCSLRRRNGPQRMVSSGRGGRCSRTRRCGASCHLHGQLMRQRKEGRQRRSQRASASARKASSVGAGKKASVAWSQRSLLLAFGATTCAQSAGSARQVQEGWQWRLRHRRQRWQRWQR